MQMPSLPRDWRAGGDDFLDLPSPSELAASGSTAIQTGRPTELYSSQFVTEPAARVNECQHCGFDRVPSEAQSCPNCGDRDPLPGVVSRYAGRGTIAGVIIGICGGIVWGFFVFPGNALPRMIGGAVLGLIVGLFLGMAGGLLTGLFAKVSGAR